MPLPLEDQRVGGRSMEICPMPPMLPAGFNDLERAILPSAAVDGDFIALRRYPLSLPGVPV